MLTMTTVLKYIKGSLSLPSSFIEKTDDQLREWIEITSIPEFSMYFPDVAGTGINTDSDTYKDPERQHTWLFYDDESLEIIGIKDCYFTSSDLMISGHPFMGPFTVNSMQNWALAVFQAGVLQPFSNFNYLWKFYSPNRVEILGSSGTSPGLVVVEYERSHPPDLRRIPIAMKKIFMDLCLADIMLNIGRIRTMYGDDSIQTPFGSIPLRGEALKSEGQELHDRVIEQLRDASIPPIVIDIG